MKKGFTIRVNSADVVNSSAEVLKLNINQLKDI